MNDPVRYATTALTIRTLLISGGIAVGGALVELTVLRATKVLQPMQPLSQDYFWTVPLAQLGATLLVVLPSVLVGVWRPRQAPFIAYFAAAFVAFLDVLLLVPRLSPYAAALLATGLSVQTARVIARDTRWLQRGVRAAFGLLVCLLVLGAGIWISERRPHTTTGMTGTGGNVLLITLDTVRAANLSLYGYRRETTPNLSRMAQRAVVFERAFSTAPWTLPSHASLFTGRFPHELSTGYRTPLDGTHKTLAEYFLAKGYATAGFVGNLEYCGRDTGLSRGFQHYEDFPRSIGQVVANSTLLRMVADNFSLRRLLRNDQHLNRVGAASLNERALAWLSSQHGAPFFMFVNYFDVHEPYLPPPAFEGKFGPGRRLGRHSPLHHAMWNPAMPRGELSPDDLREEVDEYDASLAFLDQQVGLLLNELELKGLLDNTLVVITADHGEEFAEHRVLEHGYSLYRASVQVPLLVMLPQRVAAHRRVSTPVSLRDVAATIVDVVAEPSAFPGESLASEWGRARAAGSPDRRTPVLSELTRPPGGMPSWYPISKGDMDAIVYQGVRYIRSGDGTEELYDLEVDPWERQNVAADGRHQTELDAARRNLAAALVGDRASR